MPTTTITTTADAATHDPTRAVAARVAAARKEYWRGATAVVALDDIDVAFDRGVFTAIMGPSASGKSTLMHCAVVVLTATPAAGSSLVGWVGQQCAGVLEPTCTVTMHGADHEKAVFEADQPTMYTLT